MAASFKEITEGIKNIAMIVIYSIAAYIALKELVPIMAKQATAAADDKTGESIWKLEIPKIVTWEYEHRKKVTDSVNNIVPNMIKGKAVDTKVSLTLYAPVKEVDSLNYQINSYWVYLGCFQSGRWHPQNFWLSQLPKIGDNIVARTAVYKRKSSPVKQNGDEWKLGQIIGAVDSGKSVHVIAISDAEDGDYWVFVN